MEMPSAGEPTNNKEHFISNGNDKDFDLPEATPAGEIPADIDPEAFMAEVRAEIASKDAEVSAEAAEKAKFMGAVQETIEQKEVEQALKAGTMTTSYGAKEGGVAQNTDNQNDVWRGREKL